MAFDSRLCKFLFFHFFLLVGGSLLYNIVVVFVIHWHELAMDMYVNFFKWFILVFKICCYFDKINECYFTMIYGNYGTHRQSSFCFYKINLPSGNLKWINNGYKPNNQGYGKSKMAAWLFLAPSKTSLLFIG